MMVRLKPDATYVVSAFRRTYLLASTIAAMYLRWQFEHDS